MEEKEIIQQLKNLRQMKAPDRLHEVIYRQTALLPEKYTGFYSPFAAFRMGLVFAGILLVLTTGGIVVAASHSRTGTPLYPVKLFIQKIAPHVTVHKNVKGMIAPVPTSITKPLILAPSGEEKDQQTKASTHQHNDMILPTPSTTSDGHEKSNENSQEHKTNGIKNFEDTVNKLFNRDN